MIEDDEGAYGIPDEDSIRHVRQLLEIEANLYLRLVLESLQTLHKCLIVVSYSIQNITTSTQVHHVLHVGRS